MTSVSVVIPTFNRWPQLERTLRALAVQHTAEIDLQIVVVSDGSTDGTDDRLTDGSAPCSVTFVAQPNSGPAAARNEGVKVAGGDLIVFIDDDVVPEPTCVSAHVAAHNRRDEPLVVIGPLLTPDDADLAPWVQWEQDMLYKQYDAMERGDWPATARQFYTGNASLPRAVFEEAGGFDDSFRRAEDVELAYRLHDAGLRFEYDPAARALHYAERSFDSWLAIAAAYGRNDVVFWRDRGQEWLLPSMRYEYERRHALTRAITRLGIHLPLARTALSRLSPLLVRAAVAMGARPGQLLLSALYNLEYYASAVRELGGARAFFGVDPQPARVLVREDGR